jgi:hypothetical protein
MKIFGLRFGRSLWALCSAHVSVQYRLHLNPAVSARNAIPWNLLFSHSGFTYERHPLLVVMKAGQLDVIVVVGVRPLAVVAMVSPSCMGVLHFVAAGRLGCSR